MTFILAVALVATYVVSLAVFSAWLIWELRKRAVEPAAGSVPATIPLRRRAALATVFLVAVAVNSFVAAAGYWLLTREVR